MSAVKRTAGKNISRPKPARKSTLKKRKSSIARRTTPTDSLFGTRSGRGGEGIRVGVLIAEGRGDKWDVVTVREDRTVSGRDAKRAGAGVSRAAKKIASRSRMQRLSETLAALGHPTRVAVAVKLLEGPATYRALQKISGAKAGPLYHHINHLRSAGLISPRERDLYTLTRGGRNVLLGTLVLMSVARDPRERPNVVGA